MLNLVRTEWLKMRKYPAFWWMSGIIALSYPGINYIFYKAFEEITQRGDQRTKMVMSLLLGNPFTFPEVWHTVAYASSIFIFIPAVMVIMFITNEYTYKTHRQNIIDGWSRNQFMVSKMIDVLLVSFLITILYFIVAVVTGYANFSLVKGEVWSQTKYIWLFLLQGFSQLSFAFLVAFLIRKAFIALGVFFFYFIAEEIGVQLLKKYANDTGRYLPLEISDRLIPAPAFMGKFNADRYRLLMDSVNEHILYTIILTGFIWLLCFWINNRRDL